MSYPFDFFDFAHGTLSAGKVSLLEIAQTVGTPVYVYSEKAFLSNFNRLKRELRGLNHLICFAVKSNSNQSILRLLSDAGAGMDVVSGGELYRTQAAKVPPSKVVFSGVGKTTDEMKMGLINRIYSFNVESVEELFSLNKVGVEMRRKAPVALRLNPDVDPKTHPYISTGIKKNKFGMDKNEILKIVSQLDTLPGIDLKGISIHIGSQLLSLPPLKDSFQKLVSLVEIVQEKLEKPLEFVDLGGGLGISYGEEKPPKIEHYGKMIHHFFGKQSKFRGSLKIILEPGRHISGNSGVLLTQIIYRKERRSQDFLIVDAAMNDLIRPALYGSHHGILPLKRSLLKGPFRKTQVVGPVCESSDFLGKNRLLSKALKPGDFLAVMSAGAYGFSMSSQYNSRPRPPEVLAIKNGFEMIRKRETFSDLVQGE